MTLTARMASLISASLMVACASMGPEIRVQSTAADLARLAGKWSGEYRHNGPQQRRGTIVFELTAGDDHAHGNVTMTFPETGAKARQLGSADRYPPKVLSIRFVVARTGFVEGALEPYWDPDAEARTWTTFHGEIKGSRIEGWFASRTETTPERTSGTWRVFKARARDGKTDAPTTVRYRYGAGASGSLTIAVVPPSGGQDSSIVPR